MKLKNHKDFPNITNLKRVGHANKHYINGLKAMRDRCGEIEVLEELDKKNMEKFLKDYSVGVILQSERELVEGIFKYFGTPKEKK